MSSRPRVTTRTKVIVFFCLMAVLDVIVPLPVVAVVGAYIAITRPPWFKEVVARLYQGAPPPPPPEEEDDPGG